MTRRFLALTIGLTSLAAFLVGLVVAGSLTPTPAVSGTSATIARAAAPAMGGASLLVNFADVAERINPAVVNIDAASRGRIAASRGDFPFRGDGPDVDFGPRREGDPPRKGAGTGFIIDADGHILTNHHVIDRADRITVRLTDGRSLRARVIGSDPDTDIALIKVDSAVPLAVAPLGDSDTLRVGEWVCAIGNPLAYEHTVTVGVVSYVGRKLFDTSLDNYIQTDAAINFGNSGGPLINGRGEVIGINAAISSRASNIGFAVPVNQAVAILPQLKAHGRVSRGFIGVFLMDVDPDLQRSLRLPRGDGALVQDVRSGSPGDRAGLRTYDLIIGADGVPVGGHDELIRRVSAQAPGTVVRLDVLRDGRPVNVAVKLAERPGRPETQERTAAPDERPVPSSSAPGGGIGLTVTDIGRPLRLRHDLPSDLRGVLVSRVEPMSPAFDADLERGYVVLEINRRPVPTVADYRRLTASARPGDVLTFFVYVPALEQRALRTVRLDGP
jgi:serine protease Do